MPPPIVEFPDRVDIRLKVAEKVERSDVDGLTSWIATALQDVCSLKVRVAQLLHEQWGQKSEKLRGSQFELIELAKQQSRAPDSKLPELPPAPEPPPPPEPRAPRKRGGRKPAPSELPRRCVVVEPPEEKRPLDADGKPLAPFAEDVREVIEYTPPRLEVIEYHYPKYVDPKTEKGIVVAPRVGLPIEGAIPGPALLAHTIVEKYRWYNPLHRQNQKYASMGAPIGVGTLNHWVKCGAELLRRFAELARVAAVTSPVVGTDDTPVKVLDRTKHANIRTGHMWVYLGESAVAYQFTSTWAGTEPCKTLEANAGTVQGDGYKGINPLFDGPKPVRKRAGCWMHGRRGFKKALDAGDERAAYPLGVIGRLFKVEEVADLWGLTGDERRDFRRRHSRPAIGALQAWRDLEGPHAVPKSPLGRAVTYLKNQWETLLVFLDDGDVPIDNGRVERELRKIGIGRRNWLFFGADSGGEWAAIFYTCIGNCLLADVDPEAWMTDVFAKLASGWKGKPEELMPAAWAKQQAEKVDVQRRAIA